MQEVFSAKINNIMLRIWLGCMLCLVLITPTVTRAQFFGGLDSFDGLSELLEPELTLSINQPYPQPGESVQVSLDDYASNVFGAEIDWQYNGIEIPNSTNQRQVNITAGVLGVPAVITATLTLNDGSVRQVSHTITPMYVDIIIEPQTRVPYWYNGRSLPSLGSMVNATVLVNGGQFIDPSTLVYTWQVNNDIVGHGPLRGRNKVSFETPNSSTFLLGVTVALTNGTVIGKRIQEVSVTNPRLYFFEKHSLYGIQSNPLKNNTPLIGNTMTVVAEPFYLDTRVFNNPDIAEWNLNGQTISNNNTNPYEITLGRAAYGGSTQVSFHVRSLSQILQGDEQAVRLVF